MSIDAFKNKTLHDIVVMPTTRLSSWSAAEFSILSGSVRVLEGGPIYDKKQPRYVKHCIGMFPVVFDEGGKSEAPQEIIDSAIWCGHIIKHFGHMISDFSMRIAVSAANHPDKLLLFSIKPNASIKNVPKFFWSIIDIFGAKRENIRFINKPTLVNELIVYAQAERRNGGRPGPAYLKILDSLQLPVKKCYSAVYFSRANFLRGGIAGERYLEKIMKDAGILVIRPEEHTLEQQITFCKQADKLIFAEGSAVHLLQLVGTGIGDVIIINRRSNGVYPNSFCRSLILPRARSLNYINSINHVIFGKPLINISHGMTILRINKKFFNAFKKHGFDFESLWDSQKYEESRNQDIMKYYLLIYDTNELLLGRRPLRNDVKRPVDGKMGVDRPHTH